MGNVDGGYGGSGPYVQAELPERQAWACASSIKNALTAGGYGEKLRIEENNFIYNILEGSAFGRHKFFGAPQRIGYVLISNKKVCLVMLGENKDLVEVIKSCVPNVFGFSCDVLPKSTQWLWGD